MAKGGNWERDISKFLTKWLTGSEKPYKYWRMPGSGSLSTIHEENVDLSGDIRSLAPEAEFLTDIFSIEAKIGYPHTSFFQHFKGVKNFNIKDFWIQCINDASHNNKRGMLIYKKIREKSILGIENDTKEMLERINPKLKDLPSLQLKFNTIDNLCDIIFYNMKEFFNVIKSIDIKGLLG